MEYAMLLANSDTYTLVEEQLARSLLKLRNV